MFTGLVEELGRLKRLQQGSAWGKITVEAKKVLDNIQLGDSIAINGVCLTVVDFTANDFTADVMAETLEKSNLGSLKPGTQVNLERALRPTDRMGGHIVQGHVDGIGHIILDEQIGIARLIKIETSPNVLAFIVSKGSIAIDGISLTVVEIKDNWFSVSLIPHSAAMTTLGFKKRGDQVNLETDIVGRYLYKFLNHTPEAPSSRSIDLRFLAESGFL